MKARGRSVRACFAWRWFLLCLGLSPGCSSTGGNGTVTCGQGTELKGGQCVVVARDAGRADGGAATDGGPPSSPDASCMMVTVYPDADGDGFGDASEPPTKRCIDAPGFVGNNLDCADGDAKAFPGQPEYFSVPILGARTVEPFDFNCDGTTDVKLPLSASACGPGLPRPEPDSWLGKVPECGQAGNLIVPSGDCKTQSIVQTCR